MKMKYGYTLFNSDQQPHTPNSWGSSILNGERTEYGHEIIMKLAEHESLMSFCERLFICCFYCCLKTVLQ